MNGAMHLFYVLLIGVVAAGAVFYVEDLRADVNSEMQDMQSAFSQQLASALSQQRAEFNDLSADVDYSLDSFEDGVSRLRARDERFEMDMDELSDEVDDIPIDEDVSEVAEKALDAVVRVDVFDNNGDLVQGGSGFFATRNGYIVTNAHVVLVEECVYIFDNNGNLIGVDCETKQGSAFTVAKHDGEQLKARLVGFNQEVDLAVLKVDGEIADYLSWGDSDELRVGDTVVALGNPLGLDFTATAGIVSAFRGFEDLKGDEVIQFDASISFGSSGGALVNMDGEVVGVNFAGFGGFGDFNFAIASDFARDVVDKMIRAD